MNTENNNQPVAPANSSASIRITAGDWGGDYPAANGREAIQMFFRDILADKIKLTQLSLIGMWRRSDGEEIPFRIGPALWRAGKITEDQLAASFRQEDLYFTHEQLLYMMVCDAWMLNDRAGDIGK